MSHTRPLVAPERLGQWQQAAIEVAEAAGEKALDWWARRGQLTAEQKGKNDWVSEADRDVERFIVDELRRRFPDHAFLGEESQKDSAAAGQPLWVIDPIDGTANFLRGIPLFAVSIACVLDGTPLVGVIRLPLQDETFAAARGAGAYKNGTRVAPSPITRADEAVVAVGSSRKTGTEPVAKTYAGLIEQGVEVRRLGSACVAACYVACGRVDGYVELFLNAWDVAAGIVIVDEAGGRCNDFTQGDWLAAGGAFLCASPKLYDTVAKCAGLS